MKLFKCEQPVPKRTNTLGRTKPLPGQTRPDMANCFALTVDMLSLDHQTTGRLSAKLENKGKLMGENDDLAVFSKSPQGASNLAAPLLVNRTGGIIENNRTGIR